MSGRPKRNHYSAGANGQRGRIPELRNATSRGVERHCPESQKRMYTSKGQAIRAGTERYGRTAGAYRCGSCAMWHCTRSQTPLSPAEQRELSADEAADALVAALLGKMAVNE